VTLSGEVETEETRIRNLETLVEELRGVVQTRCEDAERCREQIRVSEEDIERMRSAIAELHTGKDAVEKQVESVSAEYGELKESRDALEKEVREIKEQRDSKRENLERVSVELATVDERMNSVVSRARENFGQDLQPYVEDPARFDASEWENFDREELDRVKEKLAAFGPVNMLAVEEYEERKERFDFLDRQRADLEEARDSLVQAIRRINREARKLLNQTFQEVRDNFRQTFLTLFDGGTVDLQFDSEDPLEANIRISASPKGKRLHDISVLSSGEKALTALSFLFGIYLVKPSPFCVFDEVDAPLDDANIARFVRLLKSFTDRTQFVVITHNKKTMEAADNLYGVTMEEPGVSKLISVHLDDAERFKRHGHTAPPKAEAEAATPA
jgi:chromosome segregation protein